MNPQFRVIVIGGTGQVGSAVVQALLAESVCREVVMVTRKPVVIADPARQRSVVMETGAADFEMRVADLAKQVVGLGDRVSAVSCVGVGSGSAQWTEEQLKQLEIGVVGAWSARLLAACAKRVWRNSACCRQWVPTRAAGLSMPASWA
jgi:nucleoside-diphosphate-sugar epimerase